MENKVLSHVGVLGMRWGHRKSVGLPSRHGNSNLHREEKYKAKRKFDSKLDNEFKVKIKNSAEKTIKNFDRESTEKSVKKALKKLKDDNFLDLIAKERRDTANADIEEAIRLKKGEKDFNEKDLRKRLEKIYQKDLTATRESLREERKIFYRNVVALSLVAIGSFSASAILRRGFSF